MTHSNATVPRGFPCLWGQCSVDQCSVEWDGGQGVGPSLNARSDASEGDDMAAGACWKEP